MQADGILWASAAMSFGQKIKSHSNHSNNNHKPNPSLPSLKTDIFVRSGKIASARPAVHFQGENALHRAADIGDIKAIHHLLNSKNYDFINEQDEHGNTPFMRATRAGQFIAVRKMMGGKGVDTSARNFIGQDAYELANIYGHWKVVELMDKQMGITCLPRGMRTGGFFFKNG